MMEAETETEMIATMETTALNTTAPNCQRDNKHMNMSQKFKLMYNEMVLQEFAVLVLFKFRTNNVVNFQCSSSKTNSSMTMW